MRLAPLACVALAAPLLGCTSDTIEPSPEALSSYVTEKGPSGFVVHESGGRVAGLAVVKAPTLYYCGAQNGALPTADACVRAPSFVGRLGTNTSAGTKGSVHCVSATVEVARNFVEQHAICVSTVDMETTAKNTPLGRPLAFEVARGVPFYHVLFKSEDGIQEALLNLREADGTRSSENGATTAGTPAAPAGPQTECERLAATQAAASAAASANPNAHTLQEQALAQVEMIASGCQNSPGAPQPPAPPSARRAPGGFLERELADIADGCNYSPRIRELYEAYGPSESWEDSGGGRWTISLASPNGGARLSPEFRSAVFTLHEDEGYTRLRVPVEGGTLYGLPVSELAWSKGLENGINVFSVGFALPPSEIRDRMAELGVQLKPGEYDPEMDVSFGPELVRNEQTGISYIVCDEST